MESHTLFNKQSNVAMNKANNPSLKYYLGHFIIVDDSIQPIQPALLQRVLKTFELRIQSRQTENSIS